MESNPEPVPQSIDFVAFHRVELPRLLSSGSAGGSAGGSADGSAGEPARAGCALEPSRGALARASLGRAGPLAFRLPEVGAYTYVPREGGVDVVAGDERAETVIELDQESWEGLAQEFESVPGLIYGRKITCTRGNAMSLMRWDPALRAMYGGRPFFDVEENDLRDRNGAPLDVHRAFRRDDDREEMAHFLRTAGFLVVRSVFGADEAAAFASDAWRLHAAARPGDKQSWWGKDAEGREILCRVTAAGREPRLRALASDPRMLDLAALADHDLVPRAEGSEEATSVIFKNPEMSEGLGDLPWHRDCGMGGHAVMCPRLVASVFLTPSSAETGALRVLPGSWRGACHFIDANHNRAPRGVVLDAQPGDVSFHYSDTMHAAPPPTGRGPRGQDGYRISAVTGYTRAGGKPHGGRRHYNDALLTNDDGQIDHLEKLV